MFKFVHHVYYNSVNNQRSGFELHCTHDVFDEQLIEYLKTEIQDEHPIVVLNAKATLPRHWQTRLLQTFIDNPEINWVNALCINQHQLSPLISPFNGSLEQLDQVIYLLQDPEYFITDAINSNCFAVRHIKHLSLTTQPYAVNNLLIDSPTGTAVIEPPTTPEIGDQRPLPAHPLFTLQLQLSKLESKQIIGGYPGLDDKPTALHVVMDWGGGVHQWTNDFILAHDEMNHLVLNSQGEYYRQQQGERYQLLWQSTDGLELDQFHLTAAIKATTIHHQQYQQMLTQIVAKWEVQLMVVSSLIGHSMDCLNTGLQTLRVLHDYFPHWPSLNAQLDFETIDETHSEQALKNTQDEPFGRIHLAQLTDWQKATNDLLNHDTTIIVAPDESVKTNLLKLPFSACYEKTQIIPHGTNTLKPINYQPAAKPFKVLVLGRISPPKGMQLLDEIIQALAEEKSIQFVLLGSGINGLDFKAYPNTQVIEDYKHSDLAEQLAQISPQLGLITALTAETFSYTLSEFQMMGVPVIATAVGALNNRIEDGKDGFLMPQDASQISKKILHLKSHSEVLIQSHQYALQRPQISLSENKEAYDKLLKIKLKKPSKAYQMKGLQMPEPLAQTLESVIKRADSLAERLKINLLDLKEKQNWASQLSQHNQHLTQNIELERKENKKLTATIQQQSNAYNEQISGLENNLKDINTHLEKVNDELNATLRLRDQLSVENAALSQHLHNMESSRSWRFTKPLRTLTTYLRHQRNALRFRTAQLKNLPRRVFGSLKTRGLKQTAQIAKTKLKKPKSDATVTAHVLSENYQALTINTSANPVVSIVIPVYNHFKHTYHCLQSLAGLKDQTTFEVLVIDDCSSDETATSIKQITGINYHRQKANGGFIESCNTGAALATGEYLLFLNNDTEVLDGWLDELYNTFNSQPDAGLVGSQLLYPDGRLQEAGGIVFNDASGWNYGRLESPENPEFQHLRQASYISGASIMIRNDLFNQLGCFDQRYKPAYYEDTDLAFAVRKAGKQVYYQPLSRLIHFEGISSGTDLTSGTKKYQVINQQKFLDKWQEELKLQPAPHSDIELARFQNQPPRVLIFDACTPTPDQDSGSLRMMNLMKIFIELGYHVSFIPENMAHFKGYTQALQRLGVECIYSPTYSSPVEYLKAKGSYFEKVILSRYYVAEPVMPMIRSYCPNASIWFDTVDLHYLRETRMAELDANPMALKSAEQTKLKELNVAQLCDLTLVVSSYEQQVLATEETISDVAVLSNIHEVFGGHIGYTESQDLLFIGGYQHTPNVDGVLWFVKEILPQICAVIPDIKLHVVGSKAPQNVVDLGQHPNIEYHGFVADIEPLMQNIRIAVAPLRFGAGVKGKVNMSMSYGQPVVGTKVAVEGMYTTDSIDVMMADSADEFAAAVIKLYQDQILWEQVAKGGLKNVEKWFSFAAAKNTIAGLLQKY